MDIIRGKIPGAKKTVIYGPEGIGKSTFASRFPSPLFIDTEGSTKDMDVARTPTPSSWTMLLEQIAYVKTHPEICRTLVIDTIDWAEQMCVEHVCALHNKKGVEDFGYGNGYVYVKEEFGRFLNRLEDVVKAGVHIVLTAHAQMRKFEQPDEMGAYDRYELKLGKKTSSQTSPLVKEWADMVLFANYKTYSVAVDDKGKKHKAQGGSRVMHTAHHPCWDAKNRYGLPEEIPFEYAGIAHIMNQSVSAPTVTTSQQAAPQQTTELTATAKAEPEKQVLPHADSVQDHVPEKKQETSSVSVTQPKAGKDTIWESNPENIPKALVDLMLANNVTEWDIQNVVTAKGYYPNDVLIEKYDTGFIAGVLVGAWKKVYSMIMEMKNSGEIPFN